MKQRTASCNCGQLRVQVSGEPQRVGICHCLACQKMSGSAFALLARFTGPYVLTGTASEYLRVGDAGARFRFRFCPHCGSTLLKTEDGVANSVSIPVGAFAEPDFPAPTASIYSVRKHSWLQLPPGMRVYERDPE